MFCNLDDNRRMHKDNAISITKVASLNFLFREVSRNYDNIICAVNLQKEIESRSKGKEPRKTVN